MGKQSIMLAKGDTLTIDALTIKARIKVEHVSFAGLVKLSVVREVAEPMPGSLAAVLHAAAKLASMLPTIPQNVATYHAREELLALRTALEPFAADIARHHQPKDPQ